MQPSRGDLLPPQLRLDLVHLRLGNLSGLNERLHAGRRKARARFPHAQIKRGGLQSVVAAEFLVVVGAVVLHALGDVARLRQRRRRRKKQKRQNEDARHSGAIACHARYPSLTGGGSSTLLAARHAKAEKPGILTKRSLTIALECDNLGTSAARAPRNH